MKDARDPWWIIASAAVALHGARPIEVADVDVLLSTQDADHVLPPLGLEAAPGAAHPDFRSEILATWRALPLPVEFMAGFEHRRDGEWIAVHPRTRQAVMVGDAALFVPDRAELRRIVAGFGRAKDQARVRLLDALG